MRFLPLLLLAGIPATANADVIISNLADPITSGTAFGQNAFTVYKAFGFTMGSTDYTLDEVVLSLTSTTANPTPQVEIWSDAGGTPGAQLTTLANPAVLTGTDDFVFTSNGSFVLAAGTAYWVYVVSNPVNGDDFTWQSTGANPSGTAATAIGYEFNGNSSSFLNRLEVRGTSGTGGSLGNVYCTSNPNSTGATGGIAAAGSDVATDNDVTLTASNLPVGQFGIFVTSLTQSAGSPLGDGILCVGGNIGRYQAPSQILQADMNGEFSLTLDLMQTPQGAMFVTVMNGETWNFQGWHRDFTMGGQSSNLTDALAITFQ